MLKKKYRLKKYSAFIATYRNNHTVSDKNICIYFGREKTDNENPAKFAFVVSKKVHKRAVVRNRIKRLMREVIRDIIKNNKYTYINNYMSLIFVGKAGAIDSSYNEIKSSVDNLLNKKV